MKVAHVRERYLAFMKKQGHHILPSAPLVPQEDASTLFTGSGMQPLVPYLLGQPHQHGTKLADVQKCFRANDIEEVGDNRHTTFFEMLGNWSLGEYFKEVQIEQCFHFLTNKEEGLGLDPKRLYVTVFSGNEALSIPRDDSSAKKWQEVFKEVGIEATCAHIGTMEEGDNRGMKEGERIFFYDTSKNWWSRSGEPEQMPVGEPGGPDTEIFYDFGEEYTNPDFAHLQPHPNSDSGRFLEIGNSVFMEYQRTEEGFVPLPKKNVDFGGGLERLAAVTEQLPDIFHTDVFLPCIQALEKKTGRVYKDTPHPFRVITDHLRSTLFILADGVRPSNTDRGYVLRRLIRSALYHLHYTLKTPDCSLGAFFDVISEPYKEQYPETRDEALKQVVLAEEERFTTTLGKGMKIFLTYEKKGVINGEDIFLLQSTYGFPKELTIELAKERGTKVQLEGYSKAMQSHKVQSRTAGEKKFKGGLGDTDEKSVHYHTATHLLHQALRDVLGVHVEQKGSNITPERLRFDFSHSEKVTAEELQKVEEIVNKKIQEDLPVTQQDMPRQEAEKLGAIGLFTYGDTVRVYCIGDYSKEYCGGPHVTKTGVLGTFKIAKEEAVAAGIRRIKAVLE